MQVTQRPCTTAQPTTHNNTQYINKLPAWTRSPLVGATNREMVVMHDHTCMVVLLMHNLPHKRSILVVRATFFQVYTENGNTRDYRNQHGHSRPSTNQDRRDLVQTVPSSSPQLPPWNCEQDGGSEGVSTTIEKGTDHLRAILLF
jgi:hypothetical protein